MHHISSPPISDSPLIIDRLQLRNRVVLAPLSGVSDLPFRQLAFEYGAGMVVSEMVASRELVCGAKESKMRMQGEGISPHVVQLAGREAHWMSEAAKIAVDHGADMVDINMGCPAKKVTGGYSGSALMKDLDLAVDLIRATVTAVNVPVSLKMRLGWDDDMINAPELARYAENEGVKLVTVHGRTRNQFYEGRADWHQIAKVREAISIPLIANGDVDTKEDVRQILKVSGADAVMVGRQCQGRPWHCGYLAGNDDHPQNPKDIYEFIERHYGMMIAHYGQKIGVRQARKHLGWYLDRFAPDTSPQARTDILSSKDSEFVLAQMRSAIVEGAVVDAAIAKNVVAA